MPDESVTVLLARWRKGDRQALDELTPLVYDELRRIAARHMRRERPGHTLQTTALAHEAYLKLVDQSRVEWQSRAHFFAVAAEIIRRILIDHARAMQRDKRGGGIKPLLLDESLHLTEKKSVELIALDDALTGLAKLDPQQCRVVELRFFAGLTVEETAEVMRISRATVNRDWVTARAWLMRELSGAVD
ncbi:MAG TPA: sigma-70 family RNA polymerase sigma factor [Bryobacteraceae bacterium]|jgi:RNA polymerase sigma factor (TIGR02999 family)|nr:sigma-70 family RNA polymerase sigma factor [Bryobacteraceae bacterium]